ncbi:MAG TPA: carboxypeptidase-like regulatory domain-containing protein, partial [Thermoanaerobaculia bacterium]
MWRVVARRPGHLSLHYLPLALVEPTELPAAVLPAAAEIEVRTLGHAWVWAAASRVAAVDSPGWSAAFRAGRTDAAGRIAFPTAAGETLDVSVLAAGAAIETRRASAATLAVPASAGPRGERRLVVRDREGRPAVGVVVHAGPPHFWPLGRTGDDGLRLPASSEARELILVAADGRHQTVELPSGAGAATFRLADPVTLAGRVADERRRPIGGAVVWSGVDPGAFAVTDAEGRYRLTAPRAGRFWLQVEAAGHLPRRTWITRDHLGGGEAPAVALPAVAAVAGRVVDGGGRPLPGVEVTARAPRSFFRPDSADDRTYSDERGRFRLDRLEPGARQILTAALPGFAETRRELRTPASGESAEGVELVLAPMRRTHGRVLAAEDRPVAGAEAVLTAAGRPLPDPGAEDGWGRDDGHGDDGHGDDGRARTGADGRFVELAAPAEAVTLTIFKEGFAPTVVRGLEVPPGDASLDLGTVYLVPGLELAGTVVDAGGEAVAEAEIFLVRAAAGDATGPEATQEVAAGRPRAVTGGDGRFSVGDLVAGERAHLLVRRAGYRSAWRRHLEVPAADLTVRLEGAEALRGLVVDEAGEPVADAGVRVSWQHAAAPGL